MVIIYILFFFGCLKQKGHLICFIVINVFIIFPFFEPVTQKTENDVKIKEIYIFDDKFNKIIKDSFNELIKI